MKFSTPDWSQILIDKFIDEIIASKKEILRKLSGESYLELFIKIIFKEEANPGFHFDKSRFSLLSEIGIELDIDLYMEH